MVGEFPLPYSVLFHMSKERQALQKQYRDLSYLFEGELPTRQVSFTCLRWFDEYQNRTTHQWGHTHCTPGILKVLTRIKAVYWMEWSCAPGLFFTYSAI